MTILVEYFKVNVLGEILPRDRFSSNSEKLLLVTYYGQNRNIKNKSPFKNFVDSKGFERKIINFQAYQAFYSLKYYNRFETGSFLIRKLNQPTVALCCNLKAKIHLNRHLIAVSRKNNVFGLLI